MTSSPPGGSADPADAASPVSVVVCTRDRPGLLRECLASLKALRPAADEVLVIDNGSRDSATATIAAEAGFKLLREDRVGLNQARNLGWRSARHDIVAYVDDDVLVTETWVQQLKRVLRDPQISAVTGLVQPLNVETEAQRVFQRYGGGMSRGLFSRDFQRQSMTWHELIEVQRAGVGANMAIRRAVLAELDGFDPALDVGTPAHGGGDLDLFHRLLVRGWRLRYAPEVRVFHRDREDMMSLRRQLYDNGRSFGVYLLKIWRERTVPRTALAGYMARRAAWLVGRIGKRVLGTNPLPMPLLLAELRGSLDAPAAYAATYGRGARRSVA